METKTVAVIALTLVLMRAAGVRGNSDGQTIRLDVNGTEPYRDTAFYASIGEALYIDCSHTQKLSVFSVTEEDYNNCTLPVSIVDGGTSVLIGDCPRVITVILATNILSNQVNYAVGGRYYYAAYGVNDTTYLDYTTDLCMAGVKFQFQIEDKNNEEETVAPSSTVVPTTSETSVATETSSSVMVTATPTPGISTQPTTSTTSPTSSTTTTEATDRTETDRVTTPTVSRPSIDDVNSVIAEGVVDSAFSHHPHSSLLTFLVLLAVILTHITRWL